MTAADAIRAREIAKRPPPKEVTHGRKAVQRDTEGQAPDVEPAEAEEEVTE